jgi:predicted MFS family arabinose efflux permease
VPSVIRATYRLARTSTALSLLVAVELFWGFGMGAFETLFPPRLGDVLGSADQAAAAMGPIVAVAWVASASGAAIVSWFSRRIGPHSTAAAMRVLQGATVVGMGAFGGVAGLVTAYLMCFVIHGAANPVHMALLHDQAHASNRTTVLSLNSMVSMTAGAAGGIALGAIADRAGIPTGMYVGAVILAAAAPLYLLAGRRHTQRPPLVSIS